MPKIKLLYDIEQLLMSSGQETGICRVSLEILKQLAQRKEYEVYPIVTVLKGSNPADYLKKRGLEKLVPNIVKMPFLKRTAEQHTLYKTVRCWLLKRKYKSAYLEQLNQYDEYISLFSPISPLVYQSRLKTKMVIHDLIPIVLPQTCTPAFAKKFRSWIKKVAADEVICDSYSTRKDFLKYRPDYNPDHVKVAYWAANSEFAPCPSPSLSQKYHISAPKYFLTVSNSNPRKNILHLFDSFIEFLKKTNAQDIALVFAGPKGRTYDQLQKSIQKYPYFADKIICTGFVAEEDMPALYSQATAFIYPSLYEGFGLPILEAMQCGTPVITCNNSSLPEVGGDVAIYVSGKNSSETAKAMQDLYQNPQKQKELSLKGIQHTKLFSWEKTIKQLFNLK